MSLLVAVDLSESSRTVIDHARSLAAGYPGKIWLVHVAAPEPDFVGYRVGPQSVRDGVARHVHEEHKQLQHWAEDLRSSGLDCTALLVQGPFASTILSEADRLAVQVIVVGSHGQGAAHRLFVGSTSEGILRGAAVPVFVVPCRRRT
jgi:nucleotide-binding universal stress UspA family protein